GGTSTAARNLPDSGDAALCPAVSRARPGRVVMGGSTRAVVTAVLTAVIAVSALWPWPLFVVLAAAIGLVAAGWPPLISLPGTAAPGVFIALCGLSSLAVVVVTDSADGVAAVVGLAVVAAFIA